MPYYAELDANNIVKRVIVAPDPSWPAENLGGTWVRTVDPYTPDGVPGRYAGIGMGFDVNHPVKFAPPWSPPARDLHQEERDFYQQRYDEMTVYHNGQIVSLREADTAEGYDRVLGTRPGIIARVANFFRGSS